MPSIYREIKNGKHVVTFFQGWEQRLTNEATKGLPDYARKVYGDTSTTLTRYNPDTDFEYELDDVQVDYSIEPAQRGGMTDPSWDAYVDEVIAYWERPGKGWVQLDLTESEVEQISEQIMKNRSYGDY
jgi:hypothetical protein